MTTMTICVQKQRKDGFYPVYIRVIHNKQIAYIRTSKMIGPKGVDSKRNVRDAFVVNALSATIEQYYDRLNRKDTDRWTVKQVVEFLRHEMDDICFSDYARQHIAKMFNNGQERTSKNYDHALRHMELFAGTNRLMFAQITVSFLDSWIMSMECTHRAKEMYPICMRQVFKAAMKELNDEENDIIRIRYNPWLKVDIPSADRTEKLAITPEECRAFFSAPLPESKMTSPLSELSRDVAMMVLCLGGINTVDLYNLKKKDYHDGIIHYNRAKTKKFRADQAYMEMRVSPILLPLFYKYKADPDDEYLFSFHNRHCTSDSFGINVNIGLNKICKSMGMPKEDWYCVYTFRHTWGTVAQNDCGASIADVAFAMNHSSGHTITRGYLKLNFAPAWELNEKVIEYIFFTDKSSHRTVQEQGNEFSRFSSRQMIKGTVFFRGRILGEIQDTGFNNVDEVIRRLAGFVPDEIPVRSIVQFRIENMDKHQTAVYERQKGKGF